MPDKIFNLEFDILIKDNPVMNDRQGIMVYNKQTIGKIGEMRLIKIETIMIAPFLFDNFGKDIVIFNISEIIGKDSHFLFNLQNGKVIQIYISELNHKKNKVEFMRCPK